MPAPEKQVAMLWVIAFLLLSYISWEEILLRAGMGSSQRPAQPLVSAEITVGIQ